MTERDIKLLMHRIVPIAADICTGDPDAPILSASRLQDYVLARSFIVRTLMDNGATMEQIGRAIGRHRTTPYHLYKRLEDTLAAPRIFRADFQKWEQFKQLING